jgi:hypothetical protein
MTQQRLTAWGSHLRRRSLTRDGEARRDGFAGLLGWRGRRRIGRGRAGYSWTQSSLTSNKSSSPIAMPLRSSTRVVACTGPSRWKCGWDPTRYCATICARGGARAHGPCLVRQQQHRRSAVGDPRGRTGGVDSPLDHRCPRRQRRTGRLPQPMIAGAPRAYHPLSNSGRRL